MARSQAAVNDHCADVSHVLQRLSRCRALIQRASSWCVALFAVSGCVHVPTVPEPIATQSDSIIEVRGARGALSQRETSALLKHLGEQVPDADVLQRHLAIEQSVSGTPLYSGNRTLLLRDGDQSFAAIFSAIHHAQRYLYLEYYILEDVSYQGEQLSDLLLARHQDGVQIDVIYDAIGSLSTPSSLFTKLAEGGIHLLAFNPLSSHPLSVNDRDHRKLLLADGTLAIIGGVNLSTDYQSSSGSAGTGGEPQPAKSATNPQSWHDLDVQIQGPAVRELRRLFEQHWSKQGGDGAALAVGSDLVSPQGDQVVRIIGSESGQFTPRYYATLLSALRSAESRIWITAAYFVPTHQERVALMRAARRGLDVRLLLPSQSDSSPALAVQRSYYEELLRAGVKIYERDGGYGFLHSKVAVTDGVWCLIGSSNFDHRSVLFNDEVDAVVIGHDSGMQLEQFFDSNLEQARPITLDSWRARSWSERTREQFWRLWEQWL